MTKRKITDLYNLKFEPFDNYGSVIPGMSWCKISYNKNMVIMEKLDGIHIGVSFENDMPNVYTI